MELPSTNHGSVCNFFLNVILMLSNSNNINTKVKRQNKEQKRLKNVCVLWMKERNTLKNFWKEKTCKKYQEQRQFHDSLESKVLDVAL